MADGGGAGPPSTDREVELRRVDVGLDRAALNDEGVDTDRPFDARLGPYDQKPVALDLALERPIDPHTPLEKELPFVASARSEQRMDDGVLALHDRTTANR